MIGVEDRDRRSRLRALKLAALVNEHVGAEVATTPGTFPPGAALTTTDGAAWTLLEDDPERGLGRALAWAVRHDAADLNVLASRGTGVLARRAEHVEMPVAVWHVEERALLPAVAEPPSPEVAPTAAHFAFVPTIEQAGAEPVIEYGVVTGEERGLEVCRVVDDLLTGAVRLEVGVGAHDREAFAILHGDVPPAEALAGVVAAVAAHRRPDAPDHPLNRLAPERLLRWQLEQDPSLVGLAALRSAEPPLPRPNVKDRTPCSAHGRRADGTQVLVVCSVGVDLDLVPYAIDARLREPGVEQTMVVLPERDLVPITAELAAIADQPLSLVSLST